MGQGRLKHTDHTQDFAVHEIDDIGERKDRLLKRIDPHAVSLCEPDSFEAEQYRKLRYVLEVMRNREKEKGIAIGITSPVSGDGKSLTALNLAGTLAQDPAARVLLIDVDIRRQSIGLRKNLGAKGLQGPGLVELITDPGHNLPDVVRRLSLFNISIVPIGSHVTPPYEALNSSRFNAILSEARRNYDYVILDAPPVVPVSDCRIIGKHIDGFLLVVAASQTPREMLADALNLVDRKKVIGLIFNRSESRWARRYGYGYYKGYGMPVGRNQSLPRSKAQERNMTLLRRLIPNAIVAWAEKQ